MNNLDVINRHKVHQLVAIVAAAGGAEPGNLRDHGRAAFELGAGQGTLTFEHNNEDDHEFIAHLDVAQVPLTAEEDFFGRLLHWNWSSTELEGAFFAIDEASRRVFLCHWFPCDTSPETFSTTMQRFFSLAAALRDKLATLGPSAQSPAPAPRSDWRVINRV